MRRKPTWTTPTRLFSSLALQSRLVLARQTPLLSPCPHQLPSDCDPRLLSPTPRSVAPVSSGRSSKRTTHKVHLPSPAMGRKKKNATMMITRKKKNQGFEPTLYVHGVPYEFGIGELEPVH